MVQSTLGYWSPEQIVGLFTAVGVIVTAIFVKGKYRSNTNPTSDRDMMSSVRLHPLDLMIIEQLLASINALQGDMRDIENKINTILTDTAVIRDRQRK